MDQIKTSLDSRLQRVMANRDVTGASVAYVRADAIEVAAIGQRDEVTAAPVTCDTVFPVASLTKPIVSYAVLQLADAGVLDLDEPLSRSIVPVVPDDPLSALITLRHVLTHTCGLQNVRGKDPIRMYFAPGSWFSYSSMGFTLMQSAVEARTGEGLEATVRRLVFSPLRMRLSSLELQDRFLSNLASPHEAKERIETHRPLTANASYTLHTTASDYGSFVAAVLRGDRLKPSTWATWLTANVMVPKDEIVHLHGTPSETESDIGWGLGWGVEPSHRAFFQWGKMTGIRAFVLGSLEQQAAVVLLTNSNKGLRLMADVTRDVLPGSHAAIRWLAENVSE
ncbi:serine hydrolase [Robbsia sp. Bb-Pol-6]|uniref:Serine hydrolase n=1 Tax=Robbsia betulipollinis TaxID=2981849 RepID=A0ABT3ZR07_9BURK|nr:serine hydrolase domain-containing protein [Robbsia betulipollinis]MCY0388988.1 serine hydrolase [Robbsia betulipollinis]